MNEHKKNVDIILDFLETETLVQSGTRSITPDEFEKITINNLSFKYPGSDKLVLNSVSLEIRRGHNIAIVGLNGAGKSTFLKLITRVYDPTEGEIFVNDINLKEYDLESWKKCLGILLQEYELYSEETIAENIMLGDVSKHDQGLVEKSAIESTAYDFIKDLPMAFEQKVGTEFHGGIELSKGQKQKVVLARVLYRNAPIIILDEPTASVDALSEDVIFKAIKENHKHQARIIISHKFFNVRDADQIILIEHGSILEQGSHDKLMKIKNGKYKELFELQAEGYK
jgi:ABC-type multidrug transport system fused ATPase/permease subunit